MKSFSEKKTRSQVSLKRIKGCQARRHMALFQFLSPCTLTYSTGILRYTLTQIFFKVENNGSNSKAPYLNENWFLMSVFRNNSLRQCCAHLSSLSCSQLFFVIFLPLFLTPSSHLSPFLIQNLFGTLLYGMSNA